jgi:hypothetical protein
MNNRIRDALALLSAFLTAAVLVVVVVLALLLLAGCKDPGQSPQCKQTDPKTHKCIVWEGRT